MSIKSDKWIKQQCTPPTFMVREMRHTPNSGDSMLYFPPHEVEYLSYESRSVLEDKWRLFNASPMVGNTLGVKSFRTLTPAEKAAFKPMIVPFEAGQVREKMALTIDSYDLTVSGIQPRGRQDNKKIISYGTSSFGYDVRLAREIMIFSNVNSSIIDPKCFDEKCLVPGVLREDAGNGEYVILPPNSYLLGHTIEQFCIPRDVMVIALGKSTYARSGAIVNVTPIEAGFEGTVVIEISNSTPLPLKIYVNEGISQFVFFQSEEPCEVSYADRNGKYQKQQGIVLPRT